jgi:hypothetical protein
MTETLAFYAPEDPAGRAIHNLRNALQILSAVTHHAPAVELDGIRALVEQAIPDIATLEQLRDLNARDLRVSRDENVALGRESRVVDDAKAGLIELTSSLLDVTSSRLASTGAEYRALQAIHGRLTGQIRPLGATPDTSTPARPHAAAGGR